MALWLGLVAVPFGAGLVIGRTSPTGNDVTSAILAFCVALLPYTVVGLTLAEKVSLSKRDIFVSRQRWFWRAAYLPYRDWPPLPHEVARLERIDLDDGRLRVFRLR
jgi:hypothetical protein